MDTPDTFTGEVSCPETLEKLIENLLELGKKRAARHKAYRAEKRRRKVPRGKRRKEVLDKIGSRCHICGAKIAKGEGNVDHVLAFSAGGSDEPENYLPAHKLCNHYRWDYGPEEFQWILKMGVWARTLMKKSPPKGKSLGRRMAVRFFKHEQDIPKRRKKSGGIAQ